MTIAKDYTSATYLPEWEFNGIGDLETVKRYQLKVNSPRLLKYW
tara:strand:- start:2652 stop:2783 length:132 start_codon:yes stop_codon:yes gene_type:complete